MRRSLPLPLRRPDFPGGLVSFVEQLSGVRSLDKAMTVQSEFVKRAYETSVAESQKICELHNRLAKQTLDPFKGLTGKTPATHGKS